MLRQRQHKSFTIKSRVGFVLVMALISVGGCINDKDTSALVLKSVVDESDIRRARLNQQHHVKLGNGRYRIIEQIAFDTQNFGRVFLNSGFVSDGSSSPIEDIEGSLHAGFLHDALYHGSPYLEFERGFPGKWTKRQADQEYCFQMKRLGVPKTHQQANCRGPKMLPALFSPWDHHRKGREEYWKTQQARKDG